ncbi:MAG: carboxy-S-adenosyl-L-methionine synthase [Pirellulaceae bacterium]|nr:MAG: carboxy-S-adenosyl-L-methionine synthase [Pirellulaceae bacterium]
MAKDRIYARQRDQVEGFQFDDSVAEVFDDMIARSVPGYGAMLAMTRVLARRLARPQTRVYDLGCSLGAAVLLIRPHLPASVEIVAVDNSAPMLQRFRQRLEQQERELLAESPASPDPEHDAGHQSQAPARRLPSVDVRLEDIRQTEISRASLVIMNLTLQFLPLEERSAIIRRIHDGLLPGGGLLLSEKVRFDDPDVQSWMTELHHDFKRLQGYSDLEIAQKRQALENTLLPETIAAHQQRLLDAGFAVAPVWFQCFNFVSLLAIKEPE